MLGTIILSVLIVSLLSLIGVFTLSLKDKTLHNILSYLVAFAAGSMLAAAFFDLLPEAVEEIGLSAFTFALVGLISFFVIERFIFWHHCHKHHHDIKPYTYLNIIGDAVHNFVDGTIIAAAFVADAGLGIVTTVAIAFHEIPQEIGDFAILVHGGLSKNKALLFNFMSALAAVLGALVAYFALINVEGLIPILISLAGGGFIYVATADLLPELSDEENFKELLKHAFFLILGIVLLWLVISIAHGEAGHAQHAGEALHMMQESMH